MEPASHSVRPHTATVRILGAGPAGLTAALTLARAGRAVEVFEQRSDVGGRFGGDLQALENWTTPEDVLDELRRHGLTLDFDCQPFTSVIQMNTRHMVPIAFARPAIYVVKRGGRRIAGSLDVALRRQVEAAGVTIHFGRTLPAMDADIVATGPVGGRAFAVARGIVFDTTATDVAVGLLHNDAAYKGYSYLLTVGGYGCLCTVVFDDFRRVGECFQRAETFLLDRFQVAVTHPRRVGGVGHFSNRPRFQQGGARYVGEAAGIQDLLWGFGIRTAIRSGALAAQCLIDGRDYARAAAAQFGNGLRAGVVNRFVWETFGWRDYALILAGLRRNVLGRLRATYGFGLLHRLLYPGARSFVRRRYPYLTV